MSAREQGFTILEALVAFAILAAVLSALYAVSGSALRVIGKGDRLRQAAMLARSKLDELAATRDALPASESGTFPGSDVAWHIETHDLPGGRAGPDGLRLQSVRLILDCPNAPPLVIETRHLGARRHE